MKKADFNKVLECAAAKRWLKYTTNTFVETTYRENESQLKRKLTPEMTSFKICLACWLPFQKIYNLNPYIIIV